MNKITISQITSSSLLLIVLLPLTCLGANPSRIGTDVESSVVVPALEWTIGATVSAGSNLCLQVEVFNSGSNANPDTVTWNGTGLSLAVDFTAVQTGGVTIWHLVNPAVGSFNVVVTFSSNRNGGVHISTLQNCAQTSPIGGSSQIDTAGATSLQRQVTPIASTDLVFSMLLVDTTSSGFTSLAGQSRILDTEPLGVSYDGISDDKSATSTSLVNMGYTWTTSNVADLFVWTVEGIVDSGGGSQSASTTASDYESQNNQLWSMTWVLLLFLTSFYLVWYLVKI